MKPRRKGADEQSGQKYQTHDSYLISEISRYQHINAENSLRPILAWRWCRCRGGFLHGSRRLRDAAAAVAVDKEEEVEGEEEGRGGGEQKEGGGLAATGSQPADSSSMSTTNIIVSFLPPGPQEACAGDLKDMAVKITSTSEKQEMTSPDTKCSYISRFKKTNTLKPG